MCHKYDYVNLNQPICHLAKEDFNTWPLGRSALGTFYKLTPTVCILGAWLLSPALFVRSVMKSLAVVHSHSLYRAPLVNAPWLTFHSSLVGLWGVSRSRRLGTVFVGTASCRSLVYQGMLFQWRCA